MRNSGRKAPLAAWLDKHERTLTSVMRESGVSWTTCWRAYQGHPVSIETALRLQRVTGLPLRELVKADAPIEGL